MEEIRMMTPKDFLEDIKRRKEELFDQLDALTKEEYKYTHEQELIDAERAVGKYFKKSDTHETNIFHVKEYRKKGPFFLDGIDVCGEGITCTMFLIGNVYVTANNNQAIEISEILKDWEEITAAEYNEKKKEFFGTFNE